MHPNEIILADLDKDARKALRREAARLGPAYEAVLEIQAARQSTPPETSDQA